MIRFLSGIRCFRRSVAQFQRSNSGVVQRVETLGSRLWGLDPTLVLSSVVVATAAVTAAASVAAVSAASAAIVAASSSAGVAASAAAVPGAVLLVLVGVVGAVAGRVARTVETMAMVIFLAYNYRPRRPNIR